MYIINSEYCSKKILEMSINERQAIQGHSALFREDKNIKLPTTETKCDFRME